uniref:Uncharacterized protein n=1 Tax=Glossina austeni TaxID=7395 RepID=A0A1A9UEZ8_GLOAU
MYEPEQHIDGLSFVLYALYVFARLRAFATRRYIWQWLWQSSIEFVRTLIEKVFSLLRLHFYKIDIFKDRKKTSFFSFLSILPTPLVCKKPKTYEHSQLHFDSCGESDLEIVRKHYKTL